MLRLLTAALGLPLLLSAQPACTNGTGSFGLQHTTFVARLLSPISTRTSSQGDQFTAVVEEPAQYHGAVLEGKITKMKKPSKGVGKGKAQIAFEFDTLTCQTRSAPVRVDLRDVSNSRGVRRVDEEGRVIGKSSNKKRALSALAGGVAGAGLGAWMGGAQGAAKGGAIGLAAGLALGLTLTTSGSDLEFLPGSQFTLDVSDRGRGR